MEAVLTIAKELATALSNNEVYDSYIQARDNIAKDAELNGQLREFKKTQLEFEIKCMRDVEPSFAEEQYLSRLYAELMLHDDAKVFLSSERKMLDLINEINRIVLQDCKIDLSFL